MRRLLLIILVAGSFLAAPLAAQPDGKGGGPSEAHRVLDQAALLPAQTEAELTARLQKLERQTAIHLVVMTVDSLEGATPDDFATLMLDSWESDVIKTQYRALFLLAPNERTFTVQLRLPVDEADYAGRPDAYWFEKGEVPPSFAAKLKDIIAPAVIPRFKRGEWRSGVEDALTALEKAIGKLELQSDDKVGAFSS